MIDDDGRAPLPPPTVESLKEAAATVLGEASEAELAGGGKIFSGLGGVHFLQAPDESVGRWVGEASRELQDRLIDEAQKVRRAKEAVERAAYLDPAKNEMIKTGD